MAESNSAQNSIDPRHIEALQHFDEAIFTVDENGLTVTLKACENLGEILPAGTFDLTFLSDAIQKSGMNPGLLGWIVDSQTDAIHDFRMNDPDITDPDYAQAVVQSFQNELKKLGFEHEIIKIPTDDHDFPAACDIPMADASKPEDQQQETDFALSKTYDGPKHFGA